jgi:hypothetical protein
MTEAEWLASDDLNEMVWYAVGKDLNKNQRKTRLFVAACARSVWELITVADMRRAVEIGERFADGECTDKERYEFSVHLSDRWEAWASDQAEQSGVYALCHCAVGNGLTLAHLGRVSRWIRGAALIGQQVCRLRDIFGNPFRPVAFSPAWRTDTAITLARQMYDARDFGAMPILADALQDAGCDSDDVLNHSRGRGPHVRGCWVVDLVLGRE